MNSISDYSTTRNITYEKPPCFAASQDGLLTMLKPPDSKDKIAEGGLRLQGKYKISSDEMPLITVVTVVYNGAGFLEDTIKSVIDQTYDNVEYIIVDGGSTDGTLDIIRRYDHVIDYWVSEADKGIYYAMNKGIDLASGKWINFMNAGDSFFYKNILASMSFCDKKLCSLLYGDKVMDGKIIKALPIESLKNGLIHACHQSMFFNMSIIKEKGIRYNLKYKIYADYDLVARIYIQNKYFKYIEVPIAVFQGGGVSSSVSWQKRLDKYCSIFINFGILFFFKSVFLRVFRK